MRALALTLLILLSSATWSDEMECYSYGHKIYSGKGKDFLYEEGIFSLREERTNRIIFSTGDCVVKINT